MIFPSHLITNELLKSDVSNKRHMDEIGLRFRRPRLRVTPVLDSVCNDTSDSKFATTLLLFQYLPFIDAFVDEKSGKVVYDGFVFKVLEQVMNGLKLEYAFIIACFILSYKINLL